MHEKAFHLNFKLKHSHLHDSVVLIRSIKILSAIGHIITTQHISRAHILLKQIKREMSGNLIAVHLAPAEELSPAHDEIPSEEN